jgi:hypothetical protein
MPAGRPRQVEPGTLFPFAHQFYWDFRRLAEGHTRDWRSQVDAQKIIEQVPVPTLSDEQKKSAVTCVDEEITSGRLKKRFRAKRIEELEQMLLEITLRWAQEDAVDKHARRTLRVPGEPDVVKDLLSAKTTAQIRTICEDAFTEDEQRAPDGTIRIVRRPNWPVATGSVLPMYLSKHASSFIRAKNDPHFPRSKRPTSLSKQLWFLSRALAGAVFGIEPRTAINLVGSRLPDEVFESGYGATRPRRRRKQEA